MSVWFIGPLYVHGASQGQGASCCGDAEGTRAVWVPACPRSRLTSPCFLILMTINCFCSMSALQLQGRDRKRGKKEQGSPNKRAKEIVREREKKGL